MSSPVAVTALREEAASSPFQLRRRTAIRIKFAAFSLFGCLLLLDSLYLMVCYITFDFFGAFNSPFFGWMRASAFTAQVLYFPLFAAGLLSIDGGETEQEKHRLHVAAAILLILQLAVGFLLYCFAGGQKCIFGWTLVYGPNVRQPLGELPTYVEALACLVPLGWISAIHIAASFRAARAKTIANTLRLTPFLMAAVAATILYEGTAMVRLARAGARFPVTAAAFVLGANLVAFLAGFVVLQWIRMAANFFPNPGLAQFVLRRVAGWMLLDVVLRKIIFALLAFNDQHADWYAAAFALALIVFPAALGLRIKQQYQPITQQNRERPLRAWTLRFCAVTGLLLIFYVCAVKFVTIDWAHVIGSLGAIVTSVGILWFCVSLWREEKTYSATSLVLLSVVGIAGMGTITMGVTRGHLADSLEQYGDYDVAAFVIQHAFRPSFGDERDAAWYNFLNLHGNIRPAVAAPEIPLVTELKPAKGRKPHIFIFVIDALRRDYVSPYNPAVDFTPHLAAFAQESVIFQHAYSPYAGTALADPAMFSGFQQINKTFVSPLSRENNLQPMLEADHYDCYISYNTIVRMLSAEAHGVTPMKTDRSNQLDFGPIIEELESDILARKDATRPIFAFAQPTNVHSLWLAWNGSKTEVRPHPGFNDAYASGVERLDDTFGKFIAFLKEHRLYDDSIIVVTSDHGESLGEMGRESHVTNVTPEVIDVPLLIHLPEWEKSGMTWDTEAVVTVHDITPTLYYLLGHRSLQRGPMLGHPLFTLAGQDQETSRHADYFLMSSYGAVFGILSADQKGLFMVDATLHRNFYYDLANDPKALRNRVTPEIRAQYEPLIRQRLQEIDQLYGLAEQELGP